MNTTHHPSKTTRPLTDLSPAAVEEIPAALRELLADTFALYVKTKGFHWHMSGPHFRDYHLLLDDHADQVFAMIDPLAERARKLGGSSLRSISDIVQNQRLHDSETPSHDAEGMLGELLRDNQELTKYLRTTHDICDLHGDVATASLLENWIDETENRSWFLHEILAG